jgi:hypothetical protein
VGLTCAPPMNKAVRFFNASPTTCNEFLRPVMKWESSSSGQEFSPSQ